MWPSTNIKKETLHLGCLDHFWCWFNNNIIFYRLINQSINAPSNKTLSFQNTPNTFLPIVIQEHLWEELSRWTWKCRTGQCCVGGGSLKYLPHQTPITRLDTIMLPYLQKIFVGLQMQTLREISFQQKQMCFGLFHLEWRNLGNSFNYTLLKLVYCTKYSTKLYTFEHSLHKKRFNLINLLEFNHKSNHFGLRPRTWPPD